MTDAEYSALSSDEINEMGGTLGTFGGSKKGLKQKEQSTAMEIIQEIRDILGNPNNYLGTVFNGRIKIERMLDQLEQEIEIAELKKNDTFHNGVRQMDDEVMDGEALAKKLDATINNLFGKEFSSKLLYSNPKAEERLKAINEKLRLKFPHYKL